MRKDSLEDRDLLDHEASTFDAFLFCRDLVREKGMTQEDVGRITRAYSIAHRRRRFGADIPMADLLSTLLRCFRTTPSELSALVRAIPDGLLDRMLDMSGQATGFQALLSLEGARRRSRVAYRIDKSDDDLGTLIVTVDGQTFTLDDSFRYDAD